MAYDALLVLQAQVTKTASFSAAGINLPKGTPRRGLVARVLYSGVSTSAGAGAAVFNIDHSDDNVTFYPLAYQSDAQDVASTTASGGEAFIHFETSKPYVRLSSTLSGTGITATYSAQIGTSRP